MREEVRTLQDIELEKCLLGSFLIDIDEFYHLYESMDENIFSLPAHRRLFTKMIEQFKESEYFDFKTLSDGDMEKELYLIGLFNIPNTYGAEAYTNKLTEMYKRRQLAKLANVALNTAHKMDDDISNGLSIVQDKLMKIQGTSSEKNVFTAKESASRALDRIIERRNNPDLIENMGVKTGYYDIDHLIGSLRKGTMSLIAARPGMGKTSLLLGIMINALFAGKSVFASFLEMNDEQVMIRILSNLTRINSRRIEAGDCTDEEMQEIMRYSGILSEMPYVISTQRGITTAELSGKIKRATMKTGEMFDLVIVDYLQLLKAELHTSNLNTNVTQISSGLVEIAGNFDCAVLAASQLSRSPESRGDKRPLLSDLRDSGSLEQDAKLVGFLYRDEYYNPDGTDSPGVGEINIAKNTFGPTGQSMLAWIAENSCYRNLARG